MAIKTIGVSLILLAGTAHGGESLFTLTMKLRQDALLQYSPPSTFSGRYPWHTGITSTVFWCGEPAGQNSPSNRRSAWDAEWVNHIQNENPFYVALPVNDVANNHTLPEAAQWIPWFKSAFVRDGQSVLKDRWVAVRHGSKVCYCQLEDVGPFQTDHWQYVFGNERPRPNRNQDAGLDVSPAVRDWLGLNGLDTCDWKFVERAPVGPWTTYANTNVALLQSR